MSLFAHATRSMGLDHNPLRRRTDRVEGWAKLTATLIMVVLTPIVTVLAAHSAYLDGISQEKTDNLARERVQATLAQDATYSTSSGSEADGETTVLTQASWMAPDNSLRTGWIRATAGTTAGALVPIWVDHNGFPTNAPRAHDETLTATTATAAVIPLIMLMVVGVIHLVLRIILDRRRLSQWQDAWQRVEPGWSGRHV